jgi:tetratricopeptide (TPR) repeat protein
MRLLAPLLLATALAAQDPVDLRGWLNRGVQEFKEARYPEAVAAFERAVALDPSNLSAQLYLGTAYMQQFIPGAESPENLRVAEAAKGRFLRVLELEPSNKVALASIASLFLNQKRWDEAQQWYEKLTAADPLNADAYYSMGFIAWSRWYTVKLVSPPECDRRIPARSWTPACAPISRPATDRCLNPVCARWRRRWRSTPSTTTPWRT